MPVHAELLQRSVVRIMDDAGDFRGVGCLLTPQYAITCAHVVAAALGVKPDTKNLPEGNIRLNRPFSEEKESVAARVIERGWFPVNHPSLPDIAILQLDTPFPLQTGTFPVLSNARSLQGTSFLFWGGVEGHEEHLIDIRGVVRQPIANVRIHLDASESNYPIESGCSGAPVFDRETGDLLGLVVQKERDPDIRAGFMIPAQRLREALQHSGISLDCRTVSLSAVRKRVETTRDIRPRDRDRLCRFIDLYTTTSERPVPFVGREPFLEKLDRWLEQREQRFLLITGAAGRGKSALLLHWIARQTLRPDLEILFLPISIRFNTSDELTGLRILHAWLASLYSELRFPPGSKPDANDYRDRIYEGWERIGNQSEKHFLLVIDGIDEAASGWVLEEVLPSEIPEKLHILVAARYKPGKMDGRAWLTDLSIRETKVEDALLDLPSLNEQAVADAIVQLGRPLDRLVDKQGFVEELYRLTDQGDPLLVTLWIEQIWQDRTTAPDLTVDELKQREPSFAGFFERWLEDQEKIWQEQGLEIHREELQRLFELMSLAKGPLLLGEIHRLLQVLPLPVKWDYETLRTVLETADRLIAGDGYQQGHIFVHPRLGFHFQDQIEPKWRKQITHAFVEWGCGVCRKLNDGTLLPEECSAYLLRHYLDHLDEGLPLTAENIDRYWLSLLEGGWHRAWFEAEGAWSGFLSDLGRIERTLRQHNADRHANGDLEGMRIAAQIRCCLIRASIHTLTQNLPVPLVVGLYKEGIWSWKRTLLIVEQFEPEKQAESLTILSQWVEGEARRDVLVQALGVAERISDEQSRAEALTGVAPLLEGEPKLLLQALCIAEGIRDNRYRAEALAGVAAQLEGAARRRALRQALRAAEGIQDNRYRARTLAGVAAELKGKPELLQQALCIAEGIRDNRYRAEAMAGVAAQLEGAARKRALQQALRAAKGIRDNRYRVRALAGMAPQLEGEPELLQQALQAVERIRDNRYRAEALAGVAAQLEGAARRRVLQQALCAAEGIRDNRYRAEALAKVAAQLEGAARRMALQQALCAAEGIWDNRYRAEALAKVAAQLEGAARRRALQQALGVAERIGDERFRAEALAKVAAQLEGAARRRALQQALCIAEGIRGEWFRAEALAEIASQLEGEPELLQQALQMAEKIRNKESRAPTLASIASQLEGKAREQASQQALRAAEKIRNDESRATTLASIASQLEGKAREQALQQALRAAEKIRNEESWATTLASIASQLEGEAREQASQQTLNAAERIRNNGWSWATALADVASQLEGEPELLQQALQMAEKIRNEVSRATALAGIASRLEGKAREQALLQALRAVEGIEDSHKRIQLISSVIQQCPEMLDYPLFTDWLEHHPLQRSDLLYAIGDISRAMVQLFGDRELPEVAQAIEDVGRWWP